MDNQEFAKRVADLLRAIEFAGGEADYDYNYEDELEFNGVDKVCPCCGTLSLFKQHADDCELAVLLTAADELGRR